MNHATHNNSGVNLNDSLIIRLVELVAIRGGIGHNELKKIVVTNEHRTTIKTFDKRMKTLLKEQIIELKKGKGKRNHYYLFEFSESKKISYDKKFDREISKVKLCIEKIEKNFPDFDDHEKMTLFEILQDIQSNCIRLLNHLKQQENNSITYGDSFFMDIKEIVEEIDDKIIDKSINNLVKQAQIIDQEVKNLQKQISHIVIKLQKTTLSRKEKLIEQLIEKSKTRKLQIEELRFIGSSVHDRIAYLKIDPKNRAHYSKK